MNVVYKMPGYLSTQQFADLVGVTTNRLRDWDEAGKLKPVERTPGGKRYYTKEQAGDALFLIRKYEAEMRKSREK